MTKKILLRTMIFTLVFSTILGAPIAMAAPLAPPVLQGEPGSEEVFLNWTHENEAAVASYNIYMDQQLVATVTDTTYTADGLSNGTDFTFTVTAFDGQQSESLHSNALSLTPQELAEPQEPLEPIVDQFNFYDDDEDVGEIWGKLSVHFSQIDPSITGFKVYLLDAFNQKLQAESVPLGEMSGENYYTLDIPENTSLPIEAKRFGIYGVVEGMESEEPLATKGIWESPHRHATARLSFQDTDGTEGELSGELKLEVDQYLGESDTPYPQEVAGFKIFWGASSPMNLTEIATIHLVEDQNIYTAILPENEAIPSGTNKIYFQPFNEENEGPSYYNVFRIIDLVPEPQSTSQDTLPVVENLQYHAQYSSAYVEWVNPVLEQDVSGYILYYMDNEGNPLQQIGKIYGSNYLPRVKLPSDLIPEGAMQIGIFTANASGVSAIGAQASITEAFVPEYPHFMDTDGDANEIGGLLTWYPGMSEANIASYQVYGVDASNNRLMMYGSVPQGAASYSLQIPQDTLLENGLHGFEIIPVDAEQNSLGASVTLNITDKLQPNPAWPENAALTAETPVGQQSISLSWPAAQSEYDIIGYTIYQDGENIASVPGTQTDFIVENLTPGMLYEFSVHALAGNMMESLHPLKVEVQTALPAEVVIDIPDQALENYIRGKLAKPDGDLTNLDMLAINVIGFDFPTAVENLSGLEHALNLQTLFLQGNVSDLTPLSNLSWLQTVMLTDLPIDQNDLLVLENLPRLSSLGVVGIGGLDMQGLVPLLNSFEDLLSLNLHGNGLRDTDLLYLRENFVGMDKLLDLNLTANLIENVSMLGAPHSLQNLRIAKNRIDITAGSVNMNYIQDLVTQGVDVTYEPQNEVVEQPPVFLKKLDNLVLAVGETAVIDLEKHFVNYADNLIQYELLGVSDNIMATINGNELQIEAISPGQAQLDLHVSSDGMGMMHLPALHVVVAAEEQSLRVEQPIPNQYTLDGTELRISLDGVFNQQPDDMWVDSFSKGLDEGETFSSIYEIEYDEALNELTIRIPQLGMTDPQMSMPESELMLPSMYLPTQINLTAVYGEEEVALSFNVDIVAKQIYLMTMLQMETVDLEKDVTLQHVLDTLQRLDEGFNGFPASHFKDINVDGSFDRKDMRLWLELVNMYAGPIYL